MILKKLLPVLILLAHHFSSQAQIDTTFQSQSRLVNRNGISGKFINDIYLDHTLDHLFTNYYDFAYYEINTMSEFSEPDPYIFSITGYSFKWNKFYYNGHRINNVYFPGYSLYKPLLFNQDLDVDIIDSKINFRPDQNSEDRMNLAWSSGKFGGKVPWYNWYVNTIQGHNSAFQGAYSPIEYRKHLANSGTLYFRKTIQHGDSRIPLVGYFTSGSRKQISFSYQGADKLYPEGYNQVFLNTQIPLKNNAAFDNLQFIFGYQQRDNQFSEFYYDDSESASQDQVALSAWASRNRNKRLTTSGFNIAYDRIKHTEENFRRNLADQDGEGMEPWYPSAGIFQFNLAHTDIIPLQAKNFSIEIETNNSLIHQKALSTNSINPVYYQDFAVPFTSLYVTQWETRSFTSGILENEGNLKYHLKLKDDRLSIESKIGFSFDGFLLSQKSYMNISAQARIKLNWKINKNNTFGVDLGRRSVPLHYDYIRFLSNDYYSGISSYWNDINNDQQYEVGETNGLYTTTGGQYHFLGTKLKQPSIYYMDLYWDTHLGRNWFFTIDNQFRSFRNLWTVQYMDDTAALGSFQGVRGNSVYFLNGGQVINYEVVNLQPEIMERGAGKKLSPVFDQPFYAGSTMKVSKEGKKFFLSISFSAYMVVGFGPTGNGPLQNNIDILSENVANPNNYINFMGRLDSDRAFVVRTLVGWKLGRSFTANLLIKFKDGQPISLFDSEVISQPGGNQAAIWNVINKGINPFTGQFGFREGAFWNYEIKFNYSLKARNIPLDVFFNIYNLNDIATILNNYSFSPYTGSPNRRSGMEVQIPRGFTMGLNYYF